MMTPDPYITRPSDPQTWNPYTYVHNMPTTRIDPTGMQDRPQDGPTVTIVVNTGTGSGPSGPPAGAWDRGPTLDPTSSPPSARSASYNLSLDWTEPALREAFFKWGFLDGLTFDLMDDLFNRRHYSGDNWYDPELALQYRRGHLAADALSVYFGLQLILDAPALAASATTWALGLLASLGAPSGGATALTIPYVAAVGAAVGVTCVGTGALIAGWNIIDIEAGTRLLADLSRSYMSGAGASSGVAGSGHSATALLGSATSPFRQGTLTNAGRALTKHPEVLGFTKATIRLTLRSDAAVNAAAEGAVLGILRSGIAVVRDLGRYGRVIEVRGGSGFGARWLESTGEFIGFINP